MSQKCGSVITLDTPLHTNFFRVWLEFLKPFHQLTSGQMRVFTAILVDHYRLSKIILDETVLCETLLSLENKAKLAKSLGISKVNLRNNLAELERKQLITKDKLINSRFIPYIKDETGEFNLLIKFNISDDKKDSKKSSF